MANAMTRKAKRRKNADALPSSSLNQIFRGANFGFEVLFAVLALVCIIPVVFVFMISISSEESIRRIGYRFVPESFSAESYRFLFREGEQILRALGVSAFVTAVGTVMSIAFIMTMGYVISRRNYKLNALMTMVVFIPMVFNGGMLSSYVVNTQFMRLKDSVWALILPLCVNSFYIVIAKTFFRLNIPESLIESAQMDGATQFVIFSRIAVPLSKPLMATIAIFQTFGYWNDWFQSSLYITNTRLFSLQALLDHVQRNIQMMANNPALGVSLAQYVSAMPKEGARMAMAIIIIVPIACTYPFFQRYFISGMTIGAVKG